MKEKDRVGFNCLVLAVGYPCCEAERLDSLEPFFERLHRYHVPRRDELFVTQGGIKSNTPTHHQHEGLYLARKCRVGWGIGGRSHVGCVAFHHNIPLSVERSCECKPIPERGG